MFALIPLSNDSNEYILNVQSEYYSSSLVHTLTCERFLGGKSVAKAFKSDFSHTTVP